MVAVSGDKRLWKDHVIIEEEKTDMPSIRGRKRMILSKALDNDRGLNKELGSEAWKGA